MPNWRDIVDTAENWSEVEGLLSPVENSLITERALDQNHQATADAGIFALLRLRSSFDAVTHPESVMFLELNLPQLVPPEWGDFLKWLKGDFVEQFYDRFECIPREKWNQIRGLIVCQGGDQIPESYLTEIMRTIQNLPFSVKCIVQTGIAQSVGEDYTARNVGTISSDVFVAAGDEAKSETDGAVHEFPRAELQQIFFQMQK